MRTSRVFRPPSRFPLIDNDLRDRSALFSGPFLVFAGHLVFQRHALEVAALKRPAGGFRSRLVEPGEAGAVKRLVALLHALGEWIFRS